MDVGENSRGFVNEDVLGRKQTGFKTLSEAHQQGGEPVSPYAGATGYDPANDPYLQPGTISYMLMGSQGLR